MTQRALDIVPTDELPPLPKAYQDAATEIRKRVDDLADIASTQRPDSAFNTLNSVLTSTAEAQATFSYRHVELLLAQSRPLLDRALAGRAEWDNFFEKSLATLLELYEFVQLNAVHESEVKAGLYGLGLLESAADVTVETKTGTRAQESWNHAESAWKAAGNDNFQVSSVKMSQAMNAIPLDAHPDRVKYLNAKNDYEQANVTQRFRFNRTIAARKIGAQRAMSFVAAGGAYNYQERLAPLASRYIADFALVSGRILAIQDGLKQVYGHDVAVPKSDDGDLMSKCYVWLRNAEEFIGHVASVERGFAVPISIRALSPKGWDGNGGTWTFSVAADKFSDLVFVRLRAANVFVETSDNAAVFSGSLTAPGDIVVPVGRAMSRGGEREPDALGTLTLFNASPIGDWHLQVDEGPAAIENVYVDLMVTAIPKSALESLSDRHRPKS